MGKKRVEWEGKEKGHIKGGKVHWVLNEKKEDEIRTWVVASFCSLPIPSIISSINFCKKIFKSKLIK